MYFAKYSGYSINNGACSQAFHCDFECFAMEFSVLRYFIRIYCIFLYFSMYLDVLLPSVKFSSFFFFFLIYIFECFVLLSLNIFYIYSFIHFFFFFHIYSTHGWYIFRSFITFSYGSLCFIESLNRSGFFEYYLKKNGGLSERKNV